MKKLLSILSLFLFILQAYSQPEYLKYPSYDQVVTKFFNEYSIKNIPVTAGVKFEKRPTGWHVALIEYSTDEKKIKDELFWSRKTKKFRKIDFDAIKEKGENQEELERFQNDWAKTYYSISPYYGYPGWDYDVIRDFHDAKNLPDSTLYALGRAYSSFASNMLNNNSGLAEAKYQFRLPEGKNSLSKEQLEKYRHYRHLAIEKFRELEAKNPKFETIVGAIGTKAANEYMVSFLDLRIFQNEEEAQKEMVDSLYNDFYISASKNYLSTCEPNSILFTNGDNDTYPLLYLQSKYGFRKDVLVVNMSLLQTDRYINSLRGQVLDADGLPISILPEEIKNQKREVIVMENTDAKPMETKDAIAFIKDDKNQKSYEGTDYYYLPTNQFLFIKGKDSIQWTVNAGYFLRSQLILLDLLSTDQLKRPLYFACTLSPDSYFGLDDYMKLEGSAYRLVPDKKDSTDENFGSVNTQVMYDNLMKKFDWSGLKKVSTHEKLFCMNYRAYFYSLAEALLNEKKKDKAEEILDKSIELIPNETVSFDYFTIPYIESYYKLNRFEKGNKMAKALIKNLNESINSDNDISIALHEDHREAARMKLRALAEGYEQKEIVDLLAK